MHQPTGITVGGARPSCTRIKSLRSPHPWSPRSPPQTRQFSLRMESCSATASAQPGPCGHPPPTLCTLCWRFSRPAAGCPKVTPQWCRICGDPSHRQNSPVPPMPRRASQAEKYRRCLPAPYCLPFVFHPPEDRSTPTHLSHPHRWFVQVRHRLSLPSLCTSQYVFLGSFVWYTLRCNVWFGFPLCLVEVSRRHNIWLHAPGCTWNK